MPSEEAVIDEVAVEADEGPQGQKDRPREQQDEPRERSASPKDGSGDVSKECAVHPEEHGAESSGKADGEANGADAEPSSDGAAEGSKMVEDGSSAGKEHSTASDGSGVEQVQAPRQEEPYEPEHLEAETPSKEDSSPEASTDSSQAGSARKADEDAGEGGSQYRSNSPPEPGDDSEHELHSAGTPVASEQQAQGRERDKPGDESARRGQEALGEERDKEGEQKERDDARIDQSTSVEWVKQLLNVGSVGNIFLQGASETPHKKREHLDPMKRYPERRFDLPRVASDHQTSLWKRELSERRIIVLGCLHARVLHAAAHDLLDNELFNGYERRLLDFGVLEGDEWSNLGLRSLAETKIGADEKTVIVVNLGSRHFLDSMFQDISILWGIQDLLASRERYVLGLASNAEVLDALTARLEESHYREDEERYFFMKIPFLEPLLVCHFPETRAKELAQRIEEQRARGLWGDPEREVELLHGVTRLLRQGKRHLEKEVEARACALSGASSHDIRRVVETIDAAELFGGTDDVGRTALYEVTHFPDLQPDDFEQLMLLLLEDRTTEVEVTEEEIGSDGSVRQVTRKRERNLTALWLEGPDRILDRCHIQAIEQEDGSYLMDFAAPHLRRDLGRVLRQRHPLYLRHRLARILDRGLLFEERRSARRNRAIQLAVEMALIDRGAFDEWWLARHIMGLDAALPDEEAGEEELREEDRLVRFLVRMAEHGDLKRRVLAGLSDLIREMLLHDQLQTLVSSWLEELLKSRHHREVLRFVLDIFKSLRFAPQFDTLHWFRRLLDESPERDRSEVYEALVESGIELDHRIYELLEPLSEWLPNAEEPGPPERPSSRYALQWLADYCYRSLSEFDPDKAGAWPSSYPLFGILRQADERAESRLRLLVTWLLHPSMQWIDEEKEAEDLQAVLWSFRAAVFEEWYWVLRGPGDPTEAGGSAALGVADALLRQILAATGSDDRSRLLARWRTWRADYLEALGAPGVPRNEARQYAELRRKCSLHLERRVKELNLNEKRGAS